MNREQMIHAVCHALRRMESEAIAVVKVKVGGQEWVHIIRNPDADEALLDALVQAMIESNGFRNARATIDSIQVPRKVSVTVCVNQGLTLENDGVVFAYAQATESADSLQGAIVQAFLKAIVQLGH